MSLALYRKYRPASFAEVKGQEHVTGPLRQALRNGKVHHAYLFSGPRGCGKTSSARILARSLNCEQGPTPDPCGGCDSCIALAPNGPGSLDVIEIDAASNNGVDDARELRDRAFYAPVSSRFKVYIIDEAHMVTTAAFNALLKLVEEPPEFVKFVFATTEPEKVLQTIRSRTHHYPFRLMPRGELTSLLQSVTTSEGVPVDPTVLPLVVRAAAGSARDGLSILDQVLASAGPEGVTREAASALLGVTPDTLLDDVVEAFAVRDGKAVFAAVDHVMEGGHDPRRFAGDVLERLRDLVILDAVPDAGTDGLLDCPPEQLDRMARQAAQMGTAGLSRAADLFHDGLVEMRGTTAPRLLLELVCARVLLPAAATDLGAVLTRLERLERRLEIGGVAAAPVVPPHVPGPVHAEHPPSDHPGHHAPGTRPGPGTAPGPSQGEAPPVPPRVRAAARRGATTHERPPAGPPSPDVARAAPPAPAPAAPAPAAPAPPAWPAAASLGGPPAAPAPPTAGSGATAASAPAVAGGLDAAALRRAWDSVLLAVKERKRVTHAQLSTAQVLSVSGRTLTLSFVNGPVSRAFAGGVGVDVLKEALRETLGADLDVVSVVGTGEAPAATHEPAGGAPPPRSRGPRFDGFAPGDEAVPDDPDAPPPPTAVSGEDAALRLLQSELGGQVLGTTGD